MTDRAAASAVVIAGTDAGVAPAVARTTISPATPAGIFSGYSPAFTGGVRVAAGDINGDGVTDSILGPGSGISPEVRIYSGTGSGLLQSYNAFSPGFTGGIYVAAGDVNGDGKADVVAGAGAGGSPQVSVFSGADGSTLRSFFAYAANFTGGVTVAAGDINHDGHADIITGPASGVGAVSVFSGADGSLLRSFFPYDPGFSYGVFVGAGDINGDGFADVISGPGPGLGQQRVKAFSGVDNALVFSIQPFTDTYAAGIRVAAADYDGDNKADFILGRGSGTMNQVWIINASNGHGDLAFNPYELSYTGGVFVAGAPLVPEPGALALLGGVLCAGAIALRRRRIR